MGIVNYSGLLQVIYKISNFGITVLTVEGVKLDINSPILCLSTRK